MTAPMVRRILITNDDGINAPGLARLEKIARNLAEEVWIVAPEHDRSGAGQSISIHHPLRVYQTGEVGAVLSAHHMNIPAIALSQAFLSREGIDWAPVEQFGEAVIRKLWQPGGTLAWNVNFPACEVGDIVSARWSKQSSGSIQQARLQAGQDSRSLPYWWLGFDRSSRHIVAPDSDVAVLRDNAVAITPLRHEGTLPGGTKEFDLSAMLAG